MPESTRNCPVCTTEMQETDVYCPKCGNEYGSKQNKAFTVAKRLIIGISVIFLFFYIVVSVESMIGENTHTEIKPSSPENENVCQWDWQYTTTKTIGKYNVAPNGSNYAVVQIYIKNNADKTVSTNPYFWDFTADGIQYSVDIATFSQDVNHKTVDVAKGGEIETIIVYLINGDPEKAKLSYNGVSSPEMERVNHY